MARLPTAFSACFLIVFFLLLAPPAIAGKPSSADGRGWQQYSPPGKSGRENRGSGRDKIDICHVPPGNPGNAHRIRVGQPARYGHGVHGDPGADRDHAGSADDCDTGKPDRDHRGVGKVTICHVPPGNPGNAHSITVGRPALEAHLAHGDYLGPCDDEGNNPPVADAGPNQSVAVGSEVMLDGSASSDADGDPLTYRWTIAEVPAGSAAFLSDPGAVMPSFVADVDGEYLLDLVVNDGELDSDPDRVSIVTFVQNTPPIADAGLDQALRVGETAFLDGSGSSDTDGDALTYDWSFVSLPAGSGASLSDPAAEMPEFVVDLPGQYVLELVVDDGQASSEPDSVVVSTINTRPIADAGPDITVALGETAVLSGAGSSDADGDPLGFAWSLTTQPAGSSAVLSATDTVETGLVTDLVGVYVVQLIVSDGQLDSQPDTAVVIAVDDQAPTAVLTLLDLAGEPLPGGRVPIGEDFLLDGSDSFDPEGAIVGYIWTYPATGATAETEEPTIPASLLTGSTTLPLGVHEFELRVVDTSGNQSEPSTAIVVVFDPFPPTAVLVPLDAAGQPLVGGEVAEGENFQLDGSQSFDAEGEIVAYRWSHVDSGLEIVTVVATIDISMLVDPQALGAGPQTFELTVTDDSGNVSAPAQTVVTVVADLPPVAIARVLDAGGFPVPPGGFVVFQTPFSLDGSQSFDIGGEVVSYRWTWLDTGDSLTTVQPVIDSELLVGPVFLPIGLYLFELQVEDNTGNLSDPVQVEVIVDREPD